MATESDPAKRLIIDTVVAFLMSQTLEERKRFVEAHQKELLTDAADQIIVAMLDQPHMAGYRGYMEECRAELAQCRSDGIDAAFGSRLRLNSLLEELGHLSRSRDILRRVALAQEALTLVDRRQKPELWALLHLTLGKNLRQNPHGDKAGNIEQAINHLQMALEVYTRETSPKQWAEASSNLGATYRERVYGDKAGNIEQAINYLQMALEVYSRETFPEEWARTSGNLGAAYKERIFGERVENLEQSIRYAQNSLQIYAREAFPEQWAGTKNNLGSAYLSRILGDHAENLECAIAYYLESLEVYTREAFPDLWAGVQMNLGIVYEERIGGVRVDNLERAITHLEFALSVLPSENSSEEWAIAHIRVAHIYMDSSFQDRVDYLEQAIKHLHLVLQVVTREDHPAVWAQVQALLGGAYADRDRGERADNLEQAIKHCQQALEVYTPGDYPEEWGRVQHNLANAYRLYSRGNRAENLELAIAYFQQALEIRTQQTMPWEWALTQNNLGISYMARIRGEQADNLEQAIAHLQTALQVFTREAFPIDWARVQNNLGNAYAMRIHGIRAFNLEQAISHYERALEVRTRQNAPMSWAMTEANLGHAYMYRGEGERASNLEQAIVHTERALEVRTRSAFPSDWAETIDSLGLIYAWRILGDQADNLEQAIHLLQLSTEVHTREEASYRWAQIQVELGNIYVKRIRGERTDNINRARACYRKALEVFTPTTFPADCRATLLHLGDLHFDRQQWVDAYAAYEGAINASEAALAAAYTEKGRQAETGKTSHLYAHAAYCLLQQGKPAEAFSLLERGKTRLLTEALALSNIDVALLTETQRLAVLEARQAVRELEAEQRLPPDIATRRTDSELGNLLNQARKKLYRTIQIIRTDNPDFMHTGLDLSSMLTLIPIGGALVVPVITSQGGMVYILPHGLEHITFEHIITLNSLNEAALRRLLSGTQNEPGWSLFYADWETGKKTLQDWMTAIEAFTSQLWEMLMGPVHDRLTRLGLAEGAPVTIIPQAGLGLLPLHAAWRMVNGMKRSFLDDYTVAYAPSAYALNTSQRRLQGEGQHERTLLAVINPTDDLPYTSIETSAVTAHFDVTARQVLIGSVATKKAIMEKVVGTSYIHFSCHGYCDWTDFMHSRLLLAGDEQLTPADLISPQFNLNAARLVTLSACETGQTDFANFPDEYIGLATAFLQAGAPIVVSTLWAVSDFSTALLMQAFYRRHLSEGRSIAEALHDAQLWLRQATAGELTLAEYWEQVYQNSGQTDVGAFLAMRYYRVNPDDRPFAHPYYWAAFTYTGG